MELKRRHLFKLRPLLRWIFLLRGSPRAIAGGFGLGMFVAFTPTIGFQVIIAVLLATSFNLNRPAAIVPVWITNPFTIPTIFTFNYWVGKLIFPGPAVGDVYKQMMDIARDLATLEFLEIQTQFKTFALLGMEVFIPLVAGSVIVGTVAAFISYAVFFRILTWFSNRRRLKRKQKKYL